MSVLGSKVFFIVLFAFSVFFMKISAQKKKVLNKWTIITVLLLSAVMGFRGLKVGIDTIAYYEFFDEFSRRFVVGIRGIDEIGFVGISYLIMRLFDSVNFTFFFWALITNTLILCRIHELRERVSVPVATIAYLSTFYFLECNVLREMVAVSMIFWGSRYIFSRKYGKYVICCMLAVSMHWSAILAFALIPLSLLNNLKRYKKSQIALVIIALFASAVGAILVSYRYYGLYGRYLNSGIEASGIGIVIPLKIACFVFLSSYVGKFEIRSLSKITNDWNEVQNHRYFIKTEKYAYFIGLIMFFISYYIRYFDRAAYYLYIFEIVCYGYWYKTARRNDIIKLLIIVLILFPFAVDLLSSPTGGQGQFPYQFFWND